MVTTVATALVLASCGGLLGSEPIAAVTAVASTADPADPSPTAEPSPTVEPLDLSAYTISVERDGMTSPRDHFADSVGQDDLAVLVSDGRVSAENPPMLVGTVTYGRVMYFTMSSTEVDSARVLAIAVEAARAGVSGEAELTTEQRETLSTSEVSMLAYGGDQDLALAAIRTGDLSRFFGPANTATAAPLTFTARTLDGRLVGVADTAELQQLLCEDRELRYSFSVELSGVEGHAELSVNGREVLDVRHTPEDILEPGTQFRLGSGSATIDGDLSFGQNGADNEVELRMRNVCFDASYTIRVLRDGDAVLTESFDKPACDTTREYSIDTTTGRVVRTDG